jgi:D-alanyl-D-alanine carboxypeptidase (penicillin-binding protein 5/6)
LRRVLALGLLSLIIAASAANGATAATTDMIGGRSIAADPVLLASAPEVGALAGVLAAGDGRLLWERDADDERAMASTTKIMTGFVVLERAGLDEVVTVSARAAAVGESEAGLKAGQQLSVRALLDALLVHSANDAAVALAEHVAGSEPAFVDLMNERAASLGLRDTSFKNTHGLDERGHHTSARDLAVLARTAMQNPVFAEIVAAPTIRIPRAGGGTVKFENTNPLIGSYEGATGVKTGWTDAAGYCLVASAERNGIELTAVVLDARSTGARRDDAESLLDWGFAHCAPLELASADETAALVAVGDYLDVTVPAVVADSASAVLFDLDGPVTRHIDVRSAVPAPVKAGQRLGTVSVTQNGRLVAQVPVVAATSVPAPDMADSVGIWLKRVWRTVVGEPLQATSVAVM